MKKLTIFLVLGVLLLATPGWAADTKISAMTEDTAPAGTAIVPIVTGGVNKMAALSNFPHLLKSLGTGKGTLVGFSAASTPGTLAAGTNGYMLQADDTATLGFKWVAVPTVDGIATHFLDGTGTYRALANSDMPLITPVSGTLTDAASPYPSSNGTSGGTKVQFFTLTACAQTTTFQIPPGSWTDGDKLIIRIYSAAAQTLDFVASYHFGDAAKPTTTAAGKTQYIGFIYNSVGGAHWDCTGAVGNIP